MASLNMSDHEHEQRVLEANLAPKMFEACLGCATAGILLFMCIYGLNLHLETPKELRQVRKFYVAISFIILVLHSFAELPAPYYIFQLLYKTRNWQEVYLLKAELDMTPWVIASFCANIILVWVGDGLLVYRCYVVWVGRPLVTVLPAIVYLATVVVSFVDIVTYMTGSDIWNPQIAWIFLSVGDNCIVTFLIIFRLLHMRRQNAAIMAPIDSQVYIGIVSILVDSALPLAVTGVLVAGSTLSIRDPSVQTKSVAIMHNILSYLWADLSALAPALIIFRVAAGRSCDHNTQNNSHLSTLAFQPHTSNSSGEMRETEAAPLDGDIEKNRLEGVLEHENQIPGSDSDITGASSSYMSSIFTQCLGFN